MAALLGVVTLLLSQVPGDGWGMVDSRPREVRRLYWDLFQTTEVWVTLSHRAGALVSEQRRQLMVSGEEPASLARALTASIPAAARTPPGRR